MVASVKISPTKEIPKPEAAPVLSVNIIFDIQIMKVIVVHPSEIQGLIIEWNSFLNNKIQVSTWRMGSQDLDTWLISMVIVFVT